MVSLWKENFKLSVFTWNTGESDPKEDFLYSDSDMIVICL